MEFQRHSVPASDPGKSVSLFPYLKKWNNDSDNRTIMRPDAKYSKNVSCYLLPKLLLLFPVLTIFILAWKAGS